MTTRFQIIENLATDIQNTLIGANLKPGYTSIVYQRRVGVFDPDEFTSLPSIGIWALDDDVEQDLMDNATFRRLNMILYGYVDANEMDDYTRFYTLIEDCEKFLYSTYNRLYENTYLGKVVITYGGATEQTALFVLNFSILYSQSGLES